MKEMGRWPVNRRREGEKRGECFFNKEEKCTIASESLFQSILLLQLWLVQRHA